MLHVSTDLFQTLVLALLVVTLVVLLMILAVLSRIRSSLVVPQASEQQPDAALHDQTEEAAAPVQQSAVEEAASTSIASEPAASGSAISETSIAQEGERISTGAGTSYDDAGPTYEPASTAASAATVDTGSAQTDAEPQEQPYERGGRWYFRRGDELLVYDEAAAQWVQVEGSSPEPTTYGAAAERSETSTFSSTSSEPEVSHGVDEVEPAGYETSPASSTWGATPATEEAPEEAVPSASPWGTSAAPEESAEESPSATSTEAPADEPTEIGQPAPAPADFWRCPSCGAINGSTAPTCRMCFTPRP